MRSLGALLIGSDGHRSRRTNGNTSCWKDVFQFEDCCALRMAEGNPHCWIAGYSFARCCDEWRLSKHGRFEETLSLQERKRVAASWGGRISAGHLDLQMDPSSLLQTEAQKLLNSSASSGTEYSGLWTLYMTCMRLSCSRMTLCMYTCAYVCA